MEKEQAIEKIKKLLRLTESPNEHEAEVALKKARELMLQYHVSESSLDEQDKNTVWKEVPMTKKWMGRFYSIICKNNRCECYTSQGYRMVDGKFKLTRSIHVVGYPFDVECVLVMAELVEETVKNGISKCRHEARMLDSSESTKGVTDSYVYGFGVGLKKAFDEQNAKQEFHLMCITPQEVKDELNAVPNLHYRIERTNRGDSQNELRALIRGQDDGYATGIRRQLGDA